MARCWRSGVCVLCVSGGVHLYLTMVAKLSESCNNWSQMLESPCVVMLVAHQTPVCGCQKSAEWTKSEKKKKQSSEIKHMAGLTWRQFYNNNLLKVLLKRRSQMVAAFALQLGLQVSCMLMYGLSQICHLLEVKHSNKYCKFDATAPLETKQNFVAPVATFCQSYSQFVFWAYNWTIMKTFTHKHCFFICHSAIFLSFSLLTCYFLPNMLLASWLSSVVVYAACDM